MNETLVVLVACTHAALIAFLIIGGPLSIRRPRWARPHLIAAAVTGAVFLSGMDCPLTVVEDHFRAAAGWTTYESGFVERYLVEPLRPAGLTLAIQIALVAVWTVPTVIGHTLRCRRVVGWHTPTTVGALSMSQEDVPPASSSRWQRRTPMIDEVVSALRAVPGPSASCDERHL